MVNPPDRPEPLPRQEEPGQNAPPLSRKARRLLADIRDYEQDGLSGRAMLKRFREERGMSISDSAFWKARRLASGMRESARKVKYGGFDRTIAEDAYVIAPFTLRRARFQHIVKVSGVNSEGEKQSRFVTVSSSRPLSKRQIYAGADTLISMSVEDYNFNMARNLRFSLEEMYQS